MCICLLLFLRIFQSIFCHFTVLILLLYINCTLFTVSVVAFHWSKCYDVYWPPTQIWFGPKARLHSSDRQEMSSRTLNKTNRKWWRCRLPWPKMEVFPAHKSNNNNNEDSTPTERVERCVPTYSSLVLHTTTIVRSMNEPLMMLWNH